MTRACSPSISDVSAARGNTAIFSVVNGVILRTVDYPHPEQLMYLRTRYPGALGFWFAGADFRDSCPTRTLTVPQRFPSR
jgi:hypothetical protein